jgi:hypothetical protein
MPYKVPVISPAKVISGARSSVTTSTLEVKLDVEDIANPAMSIIKTTNVARTKSRID